jgi:hypothetical protein
MMCRTRAGTLVIAKIKTSEETYILMKGLGATPKGSVPFLDLLNMYAADLFQSFLLYLAFPLRRDCLNLLYGAQLASLQNYGNERADMGKWQREVL